MESQKLKRIVCSRMKVLTDICSYILGPDQIDKVTIKNIASRVLRLSDLLTRYRNRLPALYLKDKTLREAYIYYFLPVNMVKIFLPLNELYIHPGGFFQKDKLHILDIGCGPGTAILGILEFFHHLVPERYRPFLQFTAVDPIKENLEQAEILFKRLQKRLSIPASLETFQSEIEKIHLFDMGPFDVIIMMNLLSEIDPDHPQKIVRRARLTGNVAERFLAPQGSLIIIEPAMRITSREMLHVRDQLLRKKFTIYSPCIAGIPCPALERERDWCHEDIPWEAPEIIKEIDKLTGLKKESIKFSYFILRKDPGSLIDIYGPDIWRVVSEPLKSKGKLEFYICGPQGRYPVTRLDRDRTDRNCMFDKLQRGSIVRFHGLIQDRGRFKVIKDTEVIICRAEPVLLPDTQ